MNIILKQVLAGVIFIFLQLFLFNHLEIFSLVVPFAFLIFVFMAPMSIPIPLLYVGSFVFGLIIDLFSEEHFTGLHAFSCLLAISLRPRVLQLTGITFFRNKDEISLDNQGLLWYSFFLFPLVFIHHIAYYYLESFGSASFFTTLFKVILGSIYTFIVCYMICIAFYRK